MSEALRDTIINLYYHQRRVLMSPEIRNRDANGVTFREINEGKRARCQTARLAAEETMVTPGSSIRPSFFIVVNMIVYAAVNNPLNASSIQFIGQHVTFILIDII